MRPLGIHHVSINVHDTRAAVEFYTGVLGLSVRDDRPDFPFAGAWLDLAGQQVHLLELDVPDDRGQHFAIEVADLDGAVAELRERGVVVADPKPVGTGRQAFVRDPSGNLVELNEPSVTARPRRGAVTEFSAGSPVERSTLVRQKGRSGR